MWGWLVGVVCCVVLVGWLWWWASQDVSFSVREQVVEKVEREWQLSETQTTADGEAVIEPTVVSIAEQTVFAADDRFLADIPDSYVLLTYEGDTITHVIMNPDTNEIIRSQAYANQANAE